MFPCLQMPTNNNYRKGFDTLAKTGYRCPHCDAFVSKGDRECWACKKEVNKNGKL